MTLGFLWRIQWRREGEESLVIVALSQTWGWRFSSIWDPILKRPIWKGFYWVGTKRDVHHHSRWMLIHLTQAKIKTPANTIIMAIFPWTQLDLVDKCLEAQRDKKKKNNNNEPCCSKWCFFPLILFGMNDRRLQSQNDEETKLRESEYWPTNTWHHAICSVNQVLLLLFAVDLLSTVYCIHILEAS